MAVVVLLGAPGAGKGTQAPILARTLDVPVLASGDLLRAVAASGTDFGREVDAIMQSGQLVPDATTVRIFMNRLDQPDAKNGAILDGFPRTAPQAQALDDALAERGSGIDAVLLIEVPLEELVGRFADRVICRASGHVYNLRTNPPSRDSVCDVDGSELMRRADDEEATVRARMLQQIGPLEDVVEHYRRRGLLRTVDGRQTIDRVTAALLGALGQPGATGAA